MPPSVISEVLRDPLRQKFVDILQSHGVVHEVENVIMIEPPELRGEHMATSTVYVKVEFKDNTIKPKNLFVKKFSSNPMHTEFSRKMRIMEKESDFFNRFLPTAREFCKKYKECENILGFFPKCLHGDDEMVVLENVVLDDTWVMLDKEEQQDLFTAKYVLRNLARFHAVSHAFIKEECGGTQKFKQDWELTCSDAFIMDDNGMMEQMIDNGVNTCLSILKGHPVEGSDEATQKLQELIGKTYPEMKSLLTPDDRDFNVLNHGDCWNNNMLFKLDPVSGKVCDHIFVDLQITRLGSPSLDVGYFLYTSVKPKVRRGHFKELLQHYHDTLKSTCALFHQKCPTFEEFMKDYRVKSRLGFLINLTFLSAVGAFKEIDVENMSGNDPEAMMKEFADIINNWVERNPEKAADISLEIVESVKEEEKLRREQA